MARKDISNKLMIFGSDRKDRGIPLFYGKGSCLKYTINACKLDWENLFDFYVEPPIAFRISILINVFILWAGWLKVNNINIFSFCLSEG